MISSDDLKQWFRDDGSTPSVDVVCLVYNHEEYLRQALDGIFMQKTDFEVRVIVHDDASTDGSARIIREYQKRYPDRLRPVIQERNLMQNGKSVWKAIFPYMEGKYFAICEGDDYWTDPYKLQKQVDYLEANPDCTAVYHNVPAIDEHGFFVDLSNVGYSCLEEGDYTPREIRNRTLKTHTASLVRRRWEKYMPEEHRNVFYNCKTEGDRKELTLCGLAGRVHYLPDIMAVYRRVSDHGDSFTARQKRLTVIDREIGRYIRYTEQTKLYAYFSPSQIYIYNDILYFRAKMLKQLVRYRVSSDDIKRAVRCFDDDEIPVYAYFIFIPLLFALGGKWLFRKLKGLLNLFRYAG